MLPAEGKFRLFSRVAAAVVTLLVWQTLTASPGAWIPVTSLFAQADLVVAGTITSGSYHAGGATITIQIERVLKGSQLPGTVVSATWTRQGRTPAPLVPLDGQRGLFFLAREASSGFRLLPHMVGDVDFRHVFFPIPSGVQSTYDASLPAGDKVALELAAILEAGGDQVSVALSDLSSLAQFAREKVVRDIVARFSNSDSPRLRALGLKAQLASGNVEALIRVEREQHAIFGALFGAVVLEGIQWQFKNARPEAIAVLGRIATGDHNRLDFRIAAATSLARAHPKEALPYLARLLDTSDLDLKTCGVGGLAMFANNVLPGSFQPASSQAPYLTPETIAHSTMDKGTIAKNENYYVSFWRSWWQEHRAVLE